MDKDKAHLVATQLLLKLGAPSNYRGYKFLRSAIVRAYESPLLQTEIYVAVAGEFRTTAGNVERSIRYTIEAIVTKGNRDELRRMFFQYRRIPNGLFINRVAEELKRYKSAEVEG